MISGREALGSIDQTLTDARAQVAQLQRQITAASERQVALQREQADAYRRLARIRLGELSGMDTLDHLDSTERRVAELLSRRDEAVAALDAELAELGAGRETREAERVRRSGELDAAVNRVDKAEAVTQERLDADTAYRALRASVEEAERKAMHAGEKAERSEQERTSKGESYRNDPLFMYLWERQYGLPAYDAGGLIRWLDGKVARLIGYADARANFARLNEIPRRLQEHAEHLQQLAEAAFAQLRERDEQARADDGIPVLEQEVASVQRGIDEIDAAIADIDRRHAAKRDEKALFAVGDDDYTRSAIEHLAEEFRREDLVTLRYAALNTPYPEDDLVIAEMQQREQTSQQLSASIDGLKTAMLQHQQRLSELESVRVEFKRNRYDRAGSIFADEAVIPMLLREFLAGMLDSRMLWRVIREQQRYAPRRSDPGFGSGGFGRGTVWKGGLGDIGDIIGGIGRGGMGGGGRSSGGGGFRTGGGF